MKLFITPTYTFTPGASGVGTVNLSGISSFNVKRLVAIINQTRGVVIYSTGDTATRYTSLSGTTLTLNVDTSAHNAADVLQVIYEDTASNPLTSDQLRSAPVEVTGTFWQTTQPVSVASLPLPNGAATSANQPDITLGHPLYGSRGSVVRQAPADIWSVGFSDSASSLVAPELIQRRLGTGVGVTQSSSNLLVTMGTTGNSEFLARSTVSFRGAFTARHKTILSQRILNQQFAVLLADLIGEGLACTINSATSISVTKTAHGLTSTNVGQSMMVGAISGANGVPGRYAIASIPDANTINFTVSGWPASGSCTVDLFGWNYVWAVYSGTTATTALVDAQRKGWNSNTTAATISTTAAPGHMMQTYVDGRNVNWADTTVASSTAPTITTRASRVENLPDDDVELYVYLWAYNSSSVPASSTTWTVGFVAVEDNANVPTYIAGIRPLGNAAPIPVLTPSTQTVTFSQPALIAGTAAIGDVGIQYRASATGAASSVSVMSPATPAVATIKASAGRLIGWSLQNSSTGVRSVKVFNATAPTLGTTSANFEIDIPAGGTVQVNVEGGIAFTTAMTYSVTSAKGLTDNTSTGLAANDVSGFFLYA